MTKVLVSNVIANKPLNGGNAWVVLSWVLGFQRLGCEVLLVEEIQEASCRDRAGNPSKVSESLNLEYFREVIDHFGLTDHAVLVDRSNQLSWGKSYRELCDWAAEADVLVNITGHLSDPQLLRRIKCKVYVDLDPGFTQFWHASGEMGARLPGHDHYYTVGENIGRRTCSIPTSGIEWHPIRQPTLLEDWPVTSALNPNVFTTVGSWRGAYGQVYFQGNTYGLKVHEFRKFAELPNRTPQDFRIALDIHPDDHVDRKLLEDQNWRIVDPLKATARPSDFREYVLNSGAEFSAAQGIYVATHSGWFSDRTVRYLSAARPALVQDTGFSANLPCGEGLLPFCSLQEAVRGAEAIAQKYDHHSRAARQIAEEYFDSDKVLAKLLNEIELRSPAQVQRFPARFTNI